MTNNPAPSWLRLIAFFTESSFMLLINMIFVLLIVSQSSLVDAVLVFAIYLITFALNPLIVYNTIFLTHYFGGSFGKLVTGLAVVDEKGAPLTLNRIAFRQAIGYTFAWLVFGLGFAAIIKDPKKQGWHDKTVGSLVVVKQNLWPLGLIMCIVSLIGSAYLGNRVWQAVTTGPLTRDAQVIMIIKQLTEPAKADKEELIVPKNLLPTPTPLLEI